MFAAAVTGALVAPLPANACSKGGFVSFKDARHAHFIGIAAADTVFAGAGDTNYIVGDGHFGPGVERRIFGQVVTLERMGGLAASGIAQHKQAVLVPWDYAADCTPTPWSRSARWVEPGTRGLFIATLRDSVHWVDDMPTFDVHSPQMYPYPQRVGRMMRGRTIPPDSLLALDQAFALADLLPDHVQMRDSADTAAEPLFAWARAHPDLARRYPAREVMWTMRYALMQSRLRKIHPPIIGTYRFTIALDGGERTYYARTRSIPTSAFNTIEQPPPEDPTVVPRPPGYYLLVTGATSLDSLPRDCERDRQHHKEGYLVVVDGPPAVTQRGREWRGKIEMDLITRVFPGDAALQQVARAEFERFSRQVRAKIPIDTPARFIETAAGTLRVEQDVALDDGRRARIVGERLSRQPLVCSW